MKMKDVLKGMPTPKLIATLFESLRDRNVAESREFIKEATVELAKRPPIQGPKGDKGDPGVGAPLINNLETGGTEAALTAEMGKVISGTINSLQQRGTNFINIKNILGVITSEKLNRLIENISGPATIFFDDGEYILNDQIRISNKQNITITFSSNCRIITTQSIELKTLIFITQSSNITIDNFTGISENSTKRSNGREGLSNNTTWINVADSTNIFLNRIKITNGEFGIFIKGVQNIELFDIKMENCRQPIYSSQVNTLKIKSLSSIFNIPLNEQSALDHHIYLKDSHNDVSITDSVFSGQLKTCSVQVSAEYEFPDRITKSLHIDNIKCYNSKLFLTLDSGDISGNVSVSNLLFKNDKEFVDINTNRFPLIQIGSNHNISLSNFDVTNASNLLYCKSGNGDIHIREGVFKCDNYEVLRNHIRLFEIVECNKIMIERTSFMLGCDRYLFGLAIDTSTEPSCSITIKDCHFNIDGTGNRCMRNGINSKLFLFNNTIINNGNPQDRFLISPNASYAYNNIYKNYTLFVDSDSNNIKI